VNNQQLKSVLSAFVQWFIVWTLFSTNSIKENKMVIRISKVLSILIAASMLFGLVACQSATPAPATEAPVVQAATSVPATTAAPAATSAATSAPRVLNLWYYEPPDGALGKAWADAQTQFLATHPGVTIHFELHTFEQVQQTAQMVLNSDSAPDLIEINKGAGNAGTLAVDGLLTDMTAEATKRGWDKILAPSIETTCLYDPKTGIMGSGNLYGVTDYGEFVMLYFNQDMFTKYNIKVPTTVDELYAAADAFVAKGITPFATAGAEYPAQQIFYMLALSKANRDFVTNYQLLKGVDFHGPEFTYGATELATWVQKGYISKSAVSMKAQDMQDAFEAGKNPMLMGGSWLFGGFQTAKLPFKWDMELWPGNTISPGSGGNLWAIPAGSKNKDLAYDFIDITLSKENQTLMGNAGGIPINADTSQITDPQVQKLNTLFASMVANDGIGFYPDWPVAGYYNDLVSATQNLLNGTKTPSAFLDEIAAPYTAALKK
jgi:raffinose/stachyose/melibiose transport system substrate-binding protein